MTASPSTPAPRRAPGTAQVTGAAFVLLVPFLGPHSAGAVTPRVHAIVGARIVTTPGQIIDRGTIVMRDGVISAVGARVTVPADARVWNGEGLTIYPGLIDAFVLPAERTAPTGAPARSARAGRPAGPATRAETTRGPAHELASVHPETRVAESLPLEPEQLEGLRAAGFTVAQVAPRDGIVRGSSVVIGLGQGEANASVIRSDAAQVIALEPERNEYPGSLMGAIAVVRQALLDARWHGESHARYARTPAGRERPAANLAWEALAPVVSGLQPVLFVSGDMLELLRAAAIARESGIQAQAVGSGDEYKRVREIAATKLPLVVTVNFPEAPDVADPDRALEVSTEQLRHWNQAPENPGILSRAGVPFALTAHGLRDIKGFRSRVSSAIARGLDADAALAAVTTAPARLLGLSDRLGTIAPGKIANLTVTRGDLFSHRGQVREVWVDGVRYEMPTEGVTGTWNIAWGPGEGTLIVPAAPDTGVRLVVAGDTLVAAGVRIERPALRFTIQRGHEAPEYFFLTVESNRLHGSLTVGERSHLVTGTPVPRERPEGEEEAGHRRGRPTPERIESPILMGNTEAWRMPRPDQPAALLVRNATLWTAGPEGTIEGTDLLVRTGKIAAVGKGLRAPAHATVIDGTGKHVAPGIIDAHSHAAILGNVNECTNSVTAEVRIQDVVNSESVDLYRQLAGGTTVMHLLHGSCNAIGGQSAVIKCRWGEPPDGLLFRAAPPTIKFALGENPKQSNWDNRPDSPRYPQSRGGVQEVIRSAFTEARDYGAAWEDHRRGKRPLPPRRDLQKEAVLEILQGKRLIHSHSYRQDEILMLMRVAEEFGIRVQTFQHILEGYKVADEMATHGATASSFSDWWAYKFEVIDAIPYNGYLMWDRGVTVSFNSDSPELARRLNTEAAKAVKYGGVPPEEAIRFVTLNPAQQLKIEDRVGSLEVGKDADFSIWNGSPLSPYALCEQTWIDGRKYFDRAEDLAGRAALAQERSALIEKARSERRDPGRLVAGSWPPRYLDRADLSGNDCGGDQGEFVGEAHGRAFRTGEVQR